MYQDHFTLTDDLIQHLDNVFSKLNDPFIESRYTGFLAVSSVTVLELAMKSIFCDFALSKHKVLGNFCDLYFDRVNARINLNNIKDDYLRKFGVKYRSRFVRRLEAIESHHLQSARSSLKASYGNLLTWRHGFAHEGIIPTNATYGEVKRAYACGKEIMDCLAGCMVR